MIDERIVVTQADIERYERDGYWISPPLLDNDQIGSLRLAHDRIWSGDYDGSGYPMHGPWRPNPDPLKIRKLDNAWWVNDEIKEAVTSPILGKIAASLLKTDEVRLWHDQAIYKPGAGTQETGAGNVGWHQDYGYWQCSDTTNMVTAWIALQDTDLTNGGMMTILGSHRWGLVPGSDTFFEQDMDKLRQQYAQNGKEWVEEPCVLKAGQASFHHSLTFHGSGPNHTDIPRLSIVAHLMPRRTGYRPSVQFHPNIKFLGPRPKLGQLFDNEYFPLLFSR